MNVSRLVNILSVISIALMISSFVILQGPNSFKEVFNKTKQLANAVTSLYTVNKKQSNNNTDNTVFDEGANFYIYSLDLASTTDDIATTTKEIDTKKWRIFYDKILHEKISAITFKYPKEFSANKLEDSIVISYEVDGKLLTTVFTNNMIKLNKSAYKDITSTSTTFAEYKFDKFSYIQNSTTTVNVYVPQENDFPFASVVSFLPKKESSKYEEIIEIILDTFSVEYIEIPFKIINVKVQPTDIKLKSKYSFPTNMVYSFGTKVFNKDYASNVYLLPVIESRKGDILLQLDPILSLKDRRKTIVLPPLCEQENQQDCIPYSKLKANPFRLVIAGYACKAIGYNAENCPEELKLYIKPAYSNTFYIKAVQDFSNPQIIFKKYTDEQLEIIASVYSNQEGFDYILLFEDEEFIILNKNGNHFSVKTIKKLKDQERLILLRVSSDIVANNFYNFRNYNDLIKLGNIIYETRYTE